MSTARTRSRLSLGLLLVVITMLQVTPSPAGAQTTALFNVHYRYKTGASQDVFTTNEAERNSLLSQGFADRGVTGWCFTNAVTGTVPLHRLQAALPDGGTDHFYTTDQAEANRAVSQFRYVKIGVECYVWSSENERSIPLYRLYRGGRGHLYTTDKTARTKLIASGYTDEGITGFLVPPPGFREPKIAATTGLAPGKNRTKISSDPAAVRVLSRRIILRISGFTPAPMVEGRPGRVIVSVENASAAPLSAYFALGVDGSWEDLAGNIPDLQPRQTSMLELSLPAMTAGTHYVGVRYSGGACTSGPACSPETIIADDATSDLEVRRKPLDRLFPLVATLYQDADFQGSRRVIVGAVDDLEYQGFNDISSSILIQPGPDYAAWKQAHAGAEPVLQLFRDAFFTGGSRALPVGRYADIDATFGIPDQVSSVRYAPDDVSPDESAQSDVPPRNDLPVIVTVFATALSTCGVVPRGYSDLEIAGGYVLFGLAGAIISDMKANKCPRFHYHAWIIDDVSDFGSLGMFNDAISAARVDRGPTYNDEAVFFFADAGCRGAYIKQEKATINDTMPKDILTWMSTITGGPYPENVKGSLVDEAFNDRISSIHIGPTANCGR